MQIKIFQAMCEKDVERQVNEFISDPEIKVIKVDFTGSIFYIAAMVVYERQA